MNIEDLLRNVARQINTEINKLPQMPWPPTVEEFTGKISKNFLTSFVGWLRNPEQKQPSSTPQVIAIASLLQALITKERTPLQIL